ncbi:hypothetical protein GBAR_LOCUS3965 [Geodia barretti]|uniref:Uncharacterized protein n=1 Tax=Geodia barretti TaxID=519541 RepID=A0AA35R545_GEOBA|nr:hypothetical protein GBAR_LOCUS3965 [Geodia barretti]
MFTAGSLPSWETHGEQVLMRLNHCICVALFDDLLVRSFGMHGQCRVVQKSWTPSHSSSEASSP